MDKYLEDDEILNILEQSEDDESESGSWSASSNDGESDHLSVEELSSSEMSDTDDDSQNLNASSTCFISRNKKENWSSTPCSSNTGRTVACNIFRERTGPSRYAKSQCESESDSFKLFFRNTLLDKIRDWTNAEGLLVYKENWTAIDQSEFDKFLGVVILIGVYKSNSENVAQLWSKEDGRPIFNKLMSRNRYQQILRVLRFDNANARRSNQSADKFQPIRYVFEEWDLNFRDAYTPGPHMTVDEQLVCFRGRCPFRQYIPSKPGKYGIKVWAICEANTSYAWKMQVYTGKDPTIGREVNQGARVVKDLVKEIENSGRNVTCDDFFTSVSLHVTCFKRSLLLLEPFEQTNQNCHQNSHLRKDVR